MWEWIAAGLLALIGLAHSVLGEREVLRPLFASPEWRLGSIPRQAGETLMRFAWHLTSIAWWALAAALVGVPVVYAFAFTCLSAAVIILMLLPGHLAWPLFLAAGVLSLWSADAIPTWVLWLTLGAAIVVAVVAAAFHVAWACGARVGSANVIPQRDGGQRTFTPSPVSTATVAALLCAFIALAIVEASGGAQAWIGWLVIAALGILTLRVVGDGKWMGVSKTVRGTGFAAADDRFWTPAAATLALGAAAALALG